MNFDIKQIMPKHDKAICDIIKSVGKEYGAIGDGFGPSDQEVFAMSEHYHVKNSSQYLVATVDGKVVGGGGIASFNGSSVICELRKLFLLPESRGQGLGKALTKQCLYFAQEMGYQQCYLDTLSNMKSAILLYEKLGFKRLDAPLQGAIHNACDISMLKDLPPKITA